MPAIIPFIPWALGGIGLGALLGAKAASPTVTQPTNSMISQGAMQLAVAVAGGYIVYKLTQK